VRLEGLKKSTLSGNWTGDLPVCSIVPQPTTLPRAPVFTIILTINYRSVVRTPHWGVVDFDFSAQGSSLLTLDLSIQICVHRH
jgi:hypothetical protein